MPIEPSEPNYNKKFLHSPAHTVFAALTIGIGVASGSVIVALIGAALYGIGWINIPGSKPFRRWVDSKDEAAREEKLALEMRDFEDRRNVILRKLTTANNNKYAEIVAICKSIESATSDAVELHRKLDELSWSFLRMLDIQQALEQLAESERAEDLPAEVADAVLAVKSLEKDIIAAQGDPILMEGKKRLLASRTERLNVLQRRMDKGKRAVGNLELVQAEQERLVEQAKLIRTEAIANRNSDVLSAKIDATVDHISETSKWLTEMEDFKEMMPADLPVSGDARVGYGSVSARSDERPAAFGPVRARKRVRE